MLQPYAVSLRIGYLSDDLAALNTVSLWLYHQFLYCNPGQTLEQRIELMRARAAKKIPFCLVGYLGDKIVGNASAVACVMDTKPEMTPWLASVFVAPEFRGLGFATAL